jgi:hypothetical protein
MDFQGLKALVFFWRSSPNRQNFTFHTILYIGRENKECLVHNESFSFFCMSYKIKERFIYITLLQKYCICCIVTWLSPTLGAFSVLSPSPGHIHSTGITNSIHLFLKRIHTKAKNYFHVIHRKAIIYNGLLARNQKCRILAEKLGDLCPSNKKNI